VLAELKGYTFKWLPILDLHKEMGEKLGLSPEQVDGALKELIKKRFLKGGVALAP
jgi:hypothetical protein